MKEYILSLLTSKKIRWFLVLIAIGAIYFVYNHNNSQQLLTTVNPETKNLTQSIKIAGIVKPAEAVDMSFEVSGRVGKISTKVGDEVTLGQELIVLDNKDARARLAQASAQVSSANAVYRQSQAQLAGDQAKLDELKRGPRTEAVDLSQSKLAGARQSLVDAQRNIQIVRDRAARDISSLVDSAQLQLQEAYVDVDTAVNQYAADMFVNAQSTSPELSFSTSNQQDKLMAQSMRAQMNDELVALQKLSFKTFVGNENQIDAALVDANNRLLKVVTFLDTVKSTLNGAFSLSSTTLNTYKTSVNTARSSVLTQSNTITQALNNIKAQRLTNANLISSAETSLSSAENSVAVAERELNVVLAGASKEEIRGQEAVVRQRRLSIDGAAASVNSAQASLLEAQANYDKTILKAPFAGKVTKLDATTGQLVMGGSVSADKKNLISIVSNAGLQVEVNIPEVDIAKVALGNKVTINVDAYGETVSFAGVITTIESGETIVNGVPTYKTIIQFTQQDERLKPGMTANLDITTAQVDNVMTLPQRALIFDQGKNYIEVVYGDDNKQRERKAVEIGLTSSDGFVEIKSGLNATDRVVIQQ